MNRAGEESFARAALAEDENGRRAWCHREGPSVKLLHLFEAPTILAAGFRSPLASSVLMRRRSERRSAALEVTPVPCPNLSGAS